MVELRVQPKHRPEQDHWPEQKHKIGLQVNPSVQAAQLSTPLGGRGNCLDQSRPQSILLQRGNSGNRRATRTGDRILQFAGMALRLCDHLGRAQDGLRG